MFASGVLYKYNEFPAKGGAGGEYDTYTKNYSAPTI